MALFLDLESLASILRQSGKMFCRKIVSGTSDRLMEAIEQTRRE